MLKAIENRVSVRSYLNEPLIEKDHRMVNTTLKETESHKGPFGHRARFFFVDKKPVDGAKIGTYGFIKNPPHFIGGVIDNTFKALVDYGFLFESIILKLTDHNIGTVWLGGTFKRDQFSVNRADDEIIPCVSPVGYSAKKSLREHLIRTVSKANARKQFNNLFFYHKTKDTLPEAHPFRNYLEAVRLAPSASNKQPWRIVVDKDMCHVYLDRTPGYGNKLPFDIQAVDMGIALYHLVVSAQVDDKTITYKEEKPFDLNDAEYVFSVQIHN